MQNLRRLSLVLFLLLCSYSVSCLESAETMTDQQILTLLIENNKEVERLLIEQSKEQDLREIFLERREQTLNQDESRLTERENYLQANEKDFAELRNSYIAMMDFSQSLREEVRKENSREFWKGFGIGFAAGNFTGGIGGFALGVKIPLR